MGKTNGRGIGQNILRRIHSGYLEAWSGAINLCLQVLLTILSHYQDTLHYTENISFSSQPFHCSFICCFCSFIHINSLYLTKPPWCIFCYVPSFCMQPTHTVCSIYPFFCFSLLVLPYALLTNPIQIIFNVFFTPQTHILHNVDRRMFTATFPSFWQAFILCKRPHTIFIPILSAYAFLIFSPYSFSHLNKHSSKEYFPSNSSLHFLFHI